MALPFHPRPGTVLMCDFGTGFRPPEMVKIRPVVVVSSKRHRGAEVATVVPLSTTRPEPVESFHHRMDPASLPGWLSKRETWAKCDMLYTVALQRLDRVKVGKEPSGRRLYVAQRVTPADLAAIRAGIGHALGLDPRPQRSDDG